MKSKTWKAQDILVFVVGLLALAGLFSGHALAQLECTLPAGASPPPDLRVTAQQVEDGSASLRDFALAARDYETRTAEQAEYASCLNRQEGGPWRFGSTYLVQLTPDGRVWFHAKAMSLAGRQLKPVIYGAILHALGIDPAALTDPVAAQAAFVAAVDGDGGPFDVPGVPGASGYAYAHLAAVWPPLTVWLAGFDINESHLVPVSEEDIDYGDPAVRARDVADRATLKAFVTAAGEYGISFLDSGDSTALSKGRIAFRDPNGPWRHGPVYLTVLERASRRVMFHGAFPDRFELRQGGGIARDAVTGELIVEQLIAAAESSPEGGFWLYYFDNPDDDTDSADVPKVGYARILTAHIPLPDGSTVSTDFTVHSGFYLSADSVLVQRILEALEDGQPSITFGMTTPELWEVVAGDAVAVSVTGAPTDTVHFAHRPAGSSEAFAYLGAAANRDGVARFAWDTLDLPDDDYELVALYTEDDGYNVIYDNIEVSVDNVVDNVRRRGDGGCAALPVLPGGGPLDPTLPALVGLLLIYLLFGRRRPMRHAALG